MFYSIYQNIIISSGFICSIILIFPLLFLFLLYTYIFQYHQFISIQFHKAKQQQQYRKPIPIQGLSFPEQNWINLQIQKHQNFLWIQNVTKIKLHTYRWKSSLKQIKAIVILFHGLTSHINQGAYLGKVLSQNGYQVVGFDQRGFGKSDGLRGYLQNFDDYIEDSKKFIEYIRKQYPNKAIFPLGLSLGGLITFNLCIRQPEAFPGAILMAPALRSYHGFGSLLLVKTLSFFMPKTKVPKINRGSKRGSKNPNVSQLRKSDQYRYTQNPYITTLKNVITSMRQSEENFQKFSTPFLLIQGVKDNSVDPDGAIEFFEKSKSYRKDFLLYQNLWHNIWQQEEIYEIMQKVLKWLNEFKV